MQVFPFATGILLPLGVTVIAALRAQEAAALTAIVTVPYLYTVYAQIKQESLHIRKGESPAQLVSPSGFTFLLWHEGVLCRGSGIVGAAQLCLVLRADMKRKSHGKCDHAAFDIGQPLLPDTKSGIPTLEAYEIQQDKSSLAIFSAITEGFKVNIDDPCRPTACLT